MPTEIDVYIEHVISLSKDYNVLFDKFIKLEEKCRVFRRKDSLAGRKRNIFSRPSNLFCQRCVK